MPYKSQQQDQWGMGGEGEGEGEVKEVIEKVGRGRKKGREGLKEKGT